MRAVRSVLPLLCGFLAGCEKKEQPSVPPTPPVKGTAAATKDGRPPKPPREMPKLPALTRDSATAILRHQVGVPAADDDTRQMLLYLADLGDREGLASAKELLGEKDGKYLDLAEASLGAEALLAFGETGAAAKALAVANQYDAEGEPADEWLVHMLARIEGEERKDAVQRLVKVAADPEDPMVQGVALAALAEAGAREAADAFAKVAGDKEAEPPVRGTALAGLLHVADPRAAELTEKLVKECTDPEGQGPEPDEVIAGMGIPGVSEAGPVIRRILTALIANDDASMDFAAAASAAAIARIHAAGGGAELVPWLKGLHDDKDVNVEEETAEALWALSDDSYAAEVAKALESRLATYAPPGDTEWMIEVLDISARRGVAAKPPFADAVNTAAQLEPPPGSKAGVDLGLVALHRAAAHAFLKSSK